VLGGFPEEAIDPEYLAGKSGAHRVAGHAPIPAATWRFYETLMKPLREGQSPDKEFEEGLASSDLTGRRVMRDADIESARRRIPGTQALDERHEFVT